MDFYEDIIEMIQRDEIKTKDEIHRAKVKLCKKYKMHHLPSDVDILEHVPEDIYQDLEPILRLKPVRTTSGVAVVAVMTSPSDCPHGKCTYCPGGTELQTAQSYTGHEPAAMRAQDHNFDPYEQTRSRIAQLRTIGHPTDKIDLIIMGGTFTARDKEYQTNFIKRCFDAMNGTQAASLEDSHRLNELGPSRCIGLTIETRPDWLRPQHIDEILNLGATRVELGVQTIYDDILFNVERGHSVADSKMATRLAKDAGLKVSFHMMPGLPGSNIQKDLEAFRTIFNDPEFKPDLLKIYPCLVVGGTKLNKAWEKGDYKPYGTSECANLIAQIKEFVPKWVRISRIQRDIPVTLISDGVKKSNLRQIVQEILRERGKGCSCIRCKEVGITQISGKNIDYDSISLKKTRYSASQGKEYFLSFEDQNGILVGYCRLREPSDSAFKKEIASQPCMIVRELKVAGEMVPIGEQNQGKWQHRGFGRQLLEECEILAEEAGCEKILVTSGVGARDYYRKLGYSQNGPYMAKSL